MKVRITYFIVLLILLPLVNASSIGVSPTKIELEDMAYMHIFNPNNYSVNYSIKGVPSWIELEKEGKIDANSKKTILIKKLKNKKTNLSSYISFSNENLISAGININILTEKEKKNINYLPYLAGIIIITGLIILFR